MWSLRRTDSWSSESIIASISSSGTLPRWSDSANSRIDVSGVRSSWLTLLTKSDWSCDSLASRRM